MSLKSATLNISLELENKLHNNQQAVESHISRITELQRLIEQEEHELSVRISKSQDMVAKLLKKFDQEH